MSRASLVELTNLCVICDGSRILVQDKVGSGVVFPVGMWSRGSPCSIRLSVKCAKKPAF